MTPVVAVTAAPAGYQAEGSLALKVGSPMDADTGCPGNENVRRNAVIVARALLEVLSGWRPASQLARWTSFALQQDLERRAPRRPTGTPLQLLRIRLNVQGPGIVEVCALAEDTLRKRVRVIALRLEQRGDGWVVTRLQAG